MLDSFEESHVVDITEINLNKFDEVFFLQSKHNTDLDLSIDEDIRDNTVKETISTSNHENNSYSSLIELKRKKNKEASKKSRNKKNEDIINLIKTNELLKKQIAKLNNQLKDNICPQCKMVISNNSQICPIKPEEIGQKQMALSPSSSSALLNSLPNRARTALFISMVVIFCVLVNSFSDRGKNYLRRVSMKHYFNDYFDSIDFADNYPSEIAITKCFDFFQYYNTMNKMNEYIKGISISQETKRKSSECQVFQIDIDLNRDNDKEMVPIQLRLHANKNYLMSQIFKEDYNMSQVNTSYSKPIQLTCFDVYLNTKKT